MQAITRRLLAMSLMAASLVLTACGTSRTMITAAPQARQAVSALALMEEQSTVTVPDEVKTGLRKQLEAALYEKAKFARGEELTVRYRFVQFTAGDRFQRWFWGGIGNAGEASMTVECVFIDRSGAERAKIMSEGRIGSGFFGGSVESALEKLAEEIATFTTQNFR